MKKIYLLLLFIGINSCHKESKIIDKPIEFGELRKKLTLDYMDTHYGIV